MKEKPRHLGGVLQKQEKTLKKISSVNVENKQRVECLKRECLVPFCAEIIPENICVTIQKRVGEKVCPDIGHHGVFFRSDETMMWESFQKKPPEFRGGGVRWTKP